MDITSRSINGLAFVANSVGTAGNVSVIEINGGVLNAEAPTAEIRRTVSVFNLTINDALCTINGTSISSLTGQEPCRFFTLIRDQSGGIRYECAHRSH